MRSDRYFFRLAIVWVALSSAVCSDSQNAPSERPSDPADASVAAQDARVNDAADVRTDAGDKPDVGDTSDGGERADIGTSIDAGTSAECDPTAAPFGGGQGTRESPYLVCTPDQLDRIRIPGHEAFSYRLTDNIDLATASTPFTPIPRLTGEFDGDGYAIFNLALNDTTAGELALIVLLEGHVHDLVLPDILIEGREQVAGLVYRLVGGTEARVENVFVTGSLTVLEGRAGGVVGTMGPGASVERAFFAGTIDNRSSANGLIGGIGIDVGEGATMREVVSFATITSSAGKAGGIVADASGQISECMSAASIRAEPSEIGGIAAGLAGTATISDCLVTTRIDSASSTTGGVFATIAESRGANVTRVVAAASFVRAAGDAVASTPESSVRFQDVVFDTNVSGSSQLGNRVTALTTAQLQVETATGATAAFDRSAWVLEEGRYPTPGFVDTLVPDRIPCRDDAAPFGAGIGTPTRPFFVCTAAQLDQVRHHLDANFVLAQDIDLEGGLFEPIAGPFTGRFDGAGFSVRNWQFGSSNERDIALFISVGGSVRNLRLVDVQLMADRGLAALVLETVDGTSAAIEDVAVTGELTVYNGVVGGIVGALRRGATLRNAYFDGTITSSAGQFHGGVVRAVLAGATAQQVLSHGTLRLVGEAQKAGGIASDVNGTIEGAIGGLRLESASGTRVAGIAAVLGTGAVVRDSYATSSIELARDPTIVGGLFGEEFGDGQRTVERVLFLGTITGGTVDPILGRGGRGTTFSEVYFAQDRTPGPTTHGATGLTTSQLQSPATFSSWPSPPWVFESGRDPRLIFEAQMR